MGTPDFAVPCVQSLARHPAVDLVAVVCQPDRRRGRHRTPQPPPVKVAAIEAGVPEILQPRRIKTGAFPERLEAIGPDLIVVTAYGRILPRRILDLPRLGCVNVHASLLPRWRGAAPLQWAIAEGDEESGVCLMEMEEGLDTGAVLARVTTPISPGETGESLHDRLSALGGDLLGERLGDLLDGALVPQPQDDGLATYARMLTRDDGRLDWSLDAREVERRIRAFYPWPGAWTTLGDGRVLKLFPPCAMLPVRGEPGEVVAADAGGLVIACGRAGISAREVQIQGRRRMKVADFIQGFSFESGTRLGGAS